MEELGNHLLRESGQEVDDDGVNIEEFGNPEEDILDSGILDGD